MFCKEQAASFQRRTADIEARGAGLVFVSTGGPFFASAFREDHGITWPILVDEERVSYEVLGLRRSVLGVTGLRMLRNAARAAKAGYANSKTQGDVLQLGGVVVVLPGGAIAYQFRSNEAGDHPPIDEVLAALPTPAR